MKMKNRLDQANNTPSKKQNKVNKIKEIPAHLVDMLTMGELHLMSHLQCLADLDGYDQNAVFTDNKNYLFIKGSEPYCLVAHLDIVGSKPPLRETLIATKIPSFTDTHIEKQLVITVDGGGILGADDRAGVYAITELVSRGHRPSLLFTTGEECGGVGVKKFISDKTDLIDLDINFFMEFDRAGYMGYVVYYYQEIPNDLATMVEGAGFELEQGSYSDVADLTDSTGIAHVNLSIGYEYQHTKFEELNYTQLKNTINTVDAMLADCKITEPQMIDLFEDPSSRYGSTKYLSYFDSGYSSQDSGCEVIKVLDDIKDNIRQYDLDKFCSDGDLLYLIERYLNGYILGMYNVSFIEYVNRRQ